MLDPVPPFSAISRHSKAVELKLMAPPLRSLGKDELFFALRNSLGYYQNVALSISLTLHGVAEGAFLPLIYFAVAHALEKHPILFAIPVTDLGDDSDDELGGKSHPEPYFERLPHIKLSNVVSVLVRDVTRSSSTSDGQAGTIVDVELDRVLQGIHNTPFESGQAQWRIVVLRDASPTAKTDADLSFTLAFVYHHALGDGLSGLAFLKDFITALSGMPKKDKKEGDVAVVFAKEEALLPPLEGWKRVASVRDVSQQQEQEQKSTNLESTRLWLGTNPLNTLPLTSRFTSFSISPQTFQSLLSTVSEHKTSLTPFLQTLLTVSIFCAVSDDFDRVLGLCSFNLRSHLEALPKDAIGLFIGGCRTDYLRGQFHQSEEKLECGEDLRTAPNFWDEVRRTKGSVQAAIHRTIEAIPISERRPGTKNNLGTMLSWFRGLINTPRVASFDLNNLGKFELRDCLINPEMSFVTLGRVVFSSSQSVIGSALKINFITGPRGDLTVGFAWQDEVHDERIVRRIIDRFRHELELVR